MNRHIRRWPVQRVALIALLMLLGTITPVSHAARFDWNNQQWPVGNKLPVTYVNVDGSGVDFLLSYSDPHNVSQEGRPRSTANGLALSTVANSVFEDVVAMKFQFLKLELQTPFQSDWQIGLSKTSNGIRQKISSGVNNLSCGRLPFPRR